MTDDDRESPFSLPTRLLEALAGGHEQRHMEVRDTANRVYQFLDGLSVDQLMALRGILCMDNDSSSNNFFDGQAFTLLRVVHHVDPFTGRSLEAEAGLLDNPEAVVDAPPTGDDTPAPGGSGSGSATTEGGA